MITYVYTAKNNATGELVKAEVQADSTQAAAKLLMGQGLFPITIDNKAEQRGLAALTKARIKTKDRVIFSRQLATLINAGLPLTQSLRTVREQLQNPSLREIVDAVVTSVEGGSTLSGAFAQHPKVFDNIYVSLVQAGEATGTLDKSLERLAVQQEKDAAIAGKIRSALIYPGVILVVIILVLIFMITTVLPQIANFYKDQHKQLPFFTAALNSLSVFLVHFWWLVIAGLIGGVLALRSYLRTDQGRSLSDNVKLKVPAFGMIFRKIYMARFARTLGTMLASGISMLQALEIVRQGIGNVHVAATIGASIEAVRGGKSLSSTLENQPTFLPLVPQMIKIGEQSGAIDQMLERVAHYYEDEVDEEIKNLSTLIEPVLMVFMGVAIGGVIAAILMPIYSLVGAGVK